MMSSSMAKTRMLCSSGRSKTPFLMDDSLKLYSVQRLISELAYFGVVFYSGGDDGRVRGWKWNEFAESELSLHLQGVLYHFCCSGMKDAF